jgi:hypothetical protein
LSGVHFPNANGRYLARFVVFDRAGNVASFDKPLHWHAVCPSANDLQPFAVYDPDSSANPLPGSPFAGFVPYVPGMEVKTNPVRLLLRVPRTSWWEDATFGMSIAKRMPANVGWPNDRADWVDAEYAYERIDYPYVPGGTTLGADYRLSTPTIYSCSFPVAPNLVLSPSVPGSPKLLSITTQWQNAGVTTILNRKSNAIDTILSVSPLAEARPYAQTFNMNPIGTCVIPENATTCTITSNYVLGDTANQMELFHQWNRLLSPDGSLSSNVLMPVWQFDLRPPVVESATLSADGHSAALVLSEYQTGTWWGTVKLASAYLDAEDASGTVRRINATGLVSTDGVLMWKADISLATLPSGIYTLRFYAKDAYGNTSEPRTISGHRRDATAPTASIFTMPGRVPLHGGRLSSLSQVRFTVSDDIDLSPVVTRVRLTGGPLNDDINLGFHKQGGEYSVEFPQMLPSLANGDYVLSVTAKDSKNNSATTSATFDYGPPRFGLAPQVGTAIAVPIVDVPTRREDGLWPLTSVPAKLTEAGGMPIIGNSALTMMLSADAQGPLVVGGIRLAPGTSAVYPSYDFTASQSVLTLPVYPADPANTRPGRFGTLVVQIDRADAPAFIEDVVAWVPGENIDVVQRLPSFARHVETASISLVNRGDQYCPRLITLKEGQEYRNHLASNGIGICAAMWVSLPTKLEPHSTDPSRLTGIIASDDASVTLSYQPGILIKGPAPKREGEITTQPSPEISGDSSLFTFYPSGSPVEHSVPLHDPDPPVITLGAVSERAAQTHWLPDGKFPTDTGSVVAGYANGRAARQEYRGLHMTITDIANGAVILDQAFTSNFGRGAIRTDIPTIEGEQTFRVDLRYANHPRIATSATMTFVALPRSPMIKLIRPIDPSNITETVLEGRFGIATRTDISYDQATHGRWEIRIYRRGGGNTRTQLGSATTAIAADGTFRINLGTLPAGSYPILAQATYLGTSADITATVESLPSVIKVVDGHPVTFKLVASRDAGRAPLTTTVKLWMTDPKRGSDVESIRWERSSDGVSFQDIPLEDRYKRSFGYGERLLEPGEYWYRATTVNRYSGAVHTAEPIKVHIYDVPAFTLSGFKSTFTGTAVEWSATPESGQRPAVYRWSVRRGRYNDPEPLLMEGPTQRLPADVNGSWYITVESRFADAPDAPSAWRRVSGLLKVTPPYMSRPRIVGPYSVETGKSYRYTATAYIPIRGAADPNLVIAGRWQLPDGSTRDGDTLDYTVRPGDAEILYTAWVNGYRAETEQTTTLKLRQWEYQFPQFRMYKRQIREYDPAQYSYSIVQVSGSTGTGVEAPSYQWNFPPGTQVDQRSNTTAIVSASAPGTYPVSVRAYDTRGNDAELADSFEVSQPQPLTASLKLLVGDAWNRAPAKLTTRWYVSGLLSRESVNGITVRLNGTTMSERVLSSYTFDIAEIGKQVVDIDLRTTYGRTASYSADVEFVEGELPTCSINATTGSSLRAQAVCSVPMGRLVGYRWDVTYADTGETRDLGLRSSAIQFGSTEIARGISRIRMIAINDKGQEAPTATWTP